MTEPDPTIRVVLADDQDLVRVGLRIILESEDGIEVVGEARTGREAVELVARVEPDVVCMDVQMPELDGLAATRELIARGTRAGILVLTTFNRDDYLFEALEAGASGFVLKNSSPEDLLAAVQVVARGDALLSPDVTRRVIENVAGRRANPYPVHGAPRRWRSRCPRQTALRRTVPKVRPSAPRQSPDPADPDYRRAT